MEPQVTICCNRRENKKCFCKLIVLAILIALFTTTIGIIIGAALSGVFLAALAALIVLAIILGVLTILQIIMLLCCREKKTKCCRD